MIVVLAIAYYTWTYCPSVTHREGQERAIIVNKQKYRQEIHHTSIWEEREETGETQNAMDLDSNLPALK